MDQLTEKQLDHIDTFAVAIDDLLDFDDPQDLFINYYPDIPEEVQPHIQWAIETLGAAEAQELFMKWLFKETLVKIPFEQLKSELHKWNLHVFASCHLDAPVPFPYTWQEDFSQYIDEDTRRLADSHTASGISAFYLFVQLDFNLETIDFTRGLSKYFHSHPCKDFWVPFLGKRIYP